MNEPPEKQVHWPNELTIHELKLVTHLGWTEAERSTPQPVWITATFSQNHLPNAAWTDLLEDSVCYERLETALFDCIAHQSFKLLEHLGYIAHQCLRSKLPDHVHLSVLISKELPNSRGRRSFRL